MGTEVLLNTMLNGIREAVCTTRVAVLAELTARRTAA